jgi:hypothetical protein
MHVVLHELRTLLVQIYLGARMLEKHLPDIDPEGHSQLEKIQQQASRGILYTRGDDVTEGATLYREGLEAALKATTDPTDREIIENELRG